MENIHFLLTFLQNRFIIISMEYHAQVFVYYFVKGKGKLRRQKILCGDRDQL